jgi:hypothetical protein
MMLKVALIPLIAALCLLAQRYSPACVVRSNVPTLATARSASRYASLIRLASSALCAFEAFCSHSLLMLSSSEKRMVQSSTHYQHATESYYRFCDRSPFLRIGNVLAQLIVFSFDDLDQSTMKLFSIHRFQDFFVAPFLGVQDSPRLLDMHCLQIVSQLLTDPHAHIE